MFQQVLSCQYWHVTRPSVPADPPVVRVVDRGSGGDGETTPTRPGVVAMLAPLLLSLLPPSRALDCTTMEGLGFALAFNPGHQVAPCQLPAVKRVLPGTMAWRMDR